MLSVAEALKLVLEQAKPLAPAAVSTSETIGLALAEDVASDIDSPPHDKSIVDGYAVRSSDLVDGRADLVVLEEIVAGEVPKRPVERGSCSRIMTGAPVPEGADAVVMVERTEFFPETPNKGQLGRVRIADERLRAGQNIVRRGTSMKRGEVVLRSGAEIGPAEIGLLAEVGRTSIRAIGPVTVAILSTGNELVRAEETPSAGQIRNSNGPLLAAACRRVGAKPNDLGIARDDARELKQKIGEALASDIAVISGGVSAGVLDLVPGVLAELGVRQVFHKVNLKPGKPLWFGVRDEILVFALPGNPVSSLVCFELFVKPAIARRAGRRWDAPHPTIPAKLTREFNHRGDRPTYHPAVVRTTISGSTVEPTAWHGSGDLRGLTGANAFALFAAGDRCYQPRETIDVMMF
jgi:molybdopterin molybdotransferase